MKYLAISILFCFFLVQEALGHGKKIFFFINFIPFYTTLNLFSGAMYYPTPWWATKECSPDSLPWKCGFGELGLGDTGCTPRPAPSPPGCSKLTELVSWFTNFTFVEERTLPEEFIDTTADYSHWVTG